MASGNLSRNVRYLLWRQGIRSEKWLPVLQEELGWPRYDIENLLSGGDVGFSRSRELSAVLGRSEEELAYEDLLASDGVDVLQQNLIYLIQGAARGTKKELADKLGVGPNTISRWLGGRHHPSANRLDAIARYFGLPADLKLESDPIFLSLDPLSVKQRKEWLHHKVDALSVREMGELYPALKRLLQ